MPGPPGPTPTPFPESMPLQSASSAPALSPAPASASAAPGALDPILKPRTPAAEIEGVLVEVLRDVSFRVAPIDLQEAADMLASLRGARLLDALRGMPAVDGGRVADVLVRLGRLGADCPEIEELDVNPLLLSADGGVAVDARVLLGGAGTG